MKFTCSIVLFALLAATETTNAIKVRDDLFKDLANDLAADMAKEEGGAEEAPAKKEPAPAPAADAKTDAKKPAATEAKKSAAQKKETPAPAKGDAKKTDAAKPVEKKQENKEKTEDEIPMDNAAIKAYSSVIADAAEDSEPQKPVVYSQTIPDDEAAPRRENVGIDPMGSMIQNEISSIKEASIKAAQESD
jgi:hypothetical protein